MADDKRMIVNAEPVFDKNPPVLVTIGVGGSKPDSLVLVPLSAVQAWLQQLFNNFQLEIGPLESEGAELRYEARFVPRVAQPGEPPKGGTDES